MAAIPFSDGIACMVTERRNPVAIGAAHKIRCVRRPVFASIAVNDEIAMKSPGVIVIKLVIINHGSLKNHHFCGVVREEEQQLTFMIMHKGFLIKYLILIINREIKAVVVGGTNASPLRIRGNDNLPHFLVEPQRPEGDRLHELKIQKKPPMRTPGAMNQNYNCCRRYRPYSGGKEF
jgi:hypothetical protein